MKKIFMLLTIVSIICLCAFTSFKKLNHSSENPVTKTKPTVTISYPSEFTRFINLQQKKVEQKGKSTSKVGPVFALWWWDFNGNINQQTDPYYYSKDGDNWPDCTLVSGTTHCEIRAEGNAYDDTIPDLTTIASKKFRSF
jgi:hypothetical protein